MIYLPQMKVQFDNIWDWYHEMGGRTPTAKKECFHLYRWLFVIGSRIDTLYAHAGVRNKNRAYEVVELGTSHGATSIFMAKGFKDGTEIGRRRVECHLRTIDNGAEADLDQAINHIRAANKSFDLHIDFLRGNDLEIFSSMEPASVDFIFIDANHGYKDVMGALDLAISRIVTNGRITGHDYDFIDVGVPYAVDEWRRVNNDKVVGFGLYDSLWWMIKKSSVNP